MITEESQKSSFSGDCAVPFCVTCRCINDQVEITHSSDRKLALMFSPGEWDAFLRGVKAGEFDLE